MDNPYLLLTPGPLSTTPSVKRTMLRDWCTWDDDYNVIVQRIRHKLESLASTEGDYTSVLMQGSGTFSVESVIGSVIPPEGALAVIANGAYGKRISEIAKYLNISHYELSLSETEKPSVKKFEALLNRYKNITHVAMVHCETTTGMLNDIRPLAEVAKRHGKKVIVDAMSSFGGIPMDMREWQIDFLISSANKCIQGVPGFGFVIADRRELENCEGYARSLSLDLYSQWQTMEEKAGKWRFTSPTHVVRAFAKALEELEEEGGVQQRHKRYRKNQKSLVAGMSTLGFEPLLPKTTHSPVITAFRYPEAQEFTFEEFYQRLKEKGFVIYPGKVSDAPTFRIGTIGDVFPEDIDRLLEAVRQSMYWENEAKASLKN
ncbi:2-aminoethylphosphonate--pyruvate transaminase [Fulvitalea axinellae]|uniref:2-aminoethylphosphonate--pyruvate transaminase n=1 Tax=Fulvitalea axinellae TaxID=1182444 RepID=UPI0030CA3CCE